MAEDNRALLMMLDAKMRARNPRLGGFDQIFNPDEQMGGQPQLPTAAGRPRRHHKKAALIDPQDASDQALLGKLDDAMRYAAPGQWAIPGPGLVPAKQLGLEWYGGHPERGTPVGLDTSVLNDDDMTMLKEYARRKGLEQSAPNAALDQGQGPS